MHALGPQRRESDAASSANMGKHRLILTFPRHLELVLPSANAAWGSLTDFGGLARLENISQQNTRALSEPSARRGCSLAAGVSVAGGPETSRARQGAYTDLRNILPMRGLSSKPASSPSRLARCADTARGTKPQGCSCSTEVAHLHFAEF